MAGGTASVEGMGENITTVRLALAGLCLVFPLRRGEERTNVVL